MDKIVHGERLRGSFESEADANEWLLKRVTEINRIVRFGDTPKFTFAQAVERRLREKLEAGMPSVESDAYHLAALLPFVADMELTKMSDASFDDFRRECARRSKAAKTIHLSLSAAQAILNLASSKWRTPITNLPYLPNPPRLSLPTLAGNQRKPQPISRFEQSRLLIELPAHLKDPALFAINTGARDNVIVNLQWDWIIDNPRLQLPVVVVPKEFVKGRSDYRLLILNKTSVEAIERHRGEHSKYVFVCQRRVARSDGAASGVPKVGPFETINNTAWQAARARAKLGDLHVHDLRHTFSGRLSAANVPEDVIATLLWHSTSSVTRHYMGKHVRRLQDAVNLLDDPPEEEDISITSLIEQTLRSRPRGG